MVATRQGSMVAATIGRRHGARQARAVLTPSEPAGIPERSLEGQDRCSIDNLAAGRRGRVRGPRADRLRHRAARSAMRSRRRSTCWTAASCAWPRRPAGGWTVHQWLKKAVLLSFRLNDMSVIAGGPGRGGLVGQGAVQVRGLGRGPLPRGRLSRRARLRRAPLGLHRAGRRADALLRQSRRPRRPRHAWSTPGPPSAPAPRSARTATSRAAPASAACSSRCRPGR